MFDIGQPRLIFRRHKTNALPWWFHIQTEREESRFAKQWNILQRRKENIAQMWLDLFLFWKDLQWKLDSSQPLICWYSDLSPHKWRLHMSCQIPALVFFLLHRLYFIVLKRQLHILFYFLFLIYFEKAPSEQSSDKMSYTLIYKVEMEVGFLHNKFLGENWEEWSWSGWFF